MYSLCELERPTCRCLRELHAMGPPASMMQYVDHDKQPSTLRRDLGVQSGVEVKIGHSPFVRHPVSDLLAAQVPRIGNEGPFASSSQGSRQPHSPGLRHKASAELV